MSIALFAKRKVFDPLSIGANLVAWWDFWDTNNVYQDYLGTTPVTGPGQPIGLIVDKSGNGRNLLQSTAVNRPSYQLDSNGKPGAYFNGTNSYATTSDSGMPTDDVTIFVGLNVAKADSYKGVLGYGTASIGGSKNVYYQNTTTPNANKYILSHYGDALVIEAAAAYPQIITVTDSASISTVLQNESGNYASANLTHATVLNGTFVAGGFVNGAPFALGTVYSIILVSGILDADLQHNVRTYINNHIGAY